MVCRKVIIIAIFYIFDIVILAIEFVFIIDIVLIIEIVFTKDTLITFRGIVIVLILRFVFAKVLFVNIKTK